MKPSPHCRVALALAERRYHVLVLAEGSKIPPKGSRGLDDATADPEKLKQFFATNPRGNLAINCAASASMAARPWQRKRPSWASCPRQLRR